MSDPLSAANDAGSKSDTESSRNPLLLDWLARLTRADLSLDFFSFPLRHGKSDVSIVKEPNIEDWNAVTHICGYSIEDFHDARASLPLTSAEIDYFRRNHRGTENYVSRDFLTAQSDLPSPLAELYGLYQNRARIDAEAALWIAQSTTSTRVASAMADMLAVGSFANSMEYVTYMGVTYSVPCSFDTSAEIDHANREATRRLALPADHPSHLLRLKPDELGVLAAAIVERNALRPPAFLEKANLLAEARQDVTRLSPKEHFVTSIREQDLPPETLWTERLVKAFSRLLPEWVAGIPEIQGFLS
ncbi:MAG: hypothetical protein PHS57_08320 [Alphaproteobacteria bacterium]|nr:hypothetical protein [Alphaproteobacteria bacterium]